MAVRIEMTERIGEAFQRRREKQYWVTYYIGVIRNLSSGTIDRYGILRVIWWGLRI